MLLIEQGNKQGQQLKEFCFIWILYFIKIEHRVCIQKDGNLLNISTTMPGKWFIYFTVFIKFKVPDDFDTTCPIEIVGLFKYLLKTISHCLWNFARSSKLQAENDFHLWSSYILSTISYIRQDCLITNLCFKLLSCASIHAYLI